LESQQASITITLFCNYSGIYFVGNIIFSGKLLGTQSFVSGSVVLNLGALTKQINSGFAGLYQNKIWIKSPGTYKVEVSLNIAPNVLPPPNPGISILLLDRGVLVNSTFGSISTSASPSTVILSLTRSFNSGRLLSVELPSQFDGALVAGSWVRIVME